jgi:RNA polymerase sigma-70 factor (ECF subfamily)
MLLTLLRAAPLGRRPADSEENSSIRVRECVVGQTSAEALDLPTVYAAHGDFVWVCLQRMGIRRADLPDVHQEVFIIVHNKLSTYDGRAPIRSWLYGICRGKAASFRRRAWFRREETTDAVDDYGDESHDLDPEAALDLRRRKALVQIILDKLDVDKRTVFVMFEIEGLSCEVIASTVGVPVGTVYSRLHAARKEFEKAANKLSARWKGGLP